MPKRHRRGGELPEHLFRASPAPGVVGPSAHSAIARTVPSECLYVSGMGFGDARRKVFFHRLLDPNKQPPDPEAIASAIGGLTDPYFEDSDGYITRAEVFETGEPVSIRFFRVRREQLPGKDDGDGKQGDLNLSPDEGLLEAIHLCLYKSGYVAWEYFHYGPRVSRFATFLRKKLDMQVELTQCGAHDLIEKALKYQEIRLLRIKIDPSDASVKAITDPNAIALMKAATEFQASKYAEITLRAEIDDPGFGQKVKDLLRRLKNGNVDSAAIEGLAIDGKPAEGGPTAPLNLLSEKLYRTVDVPYEPSRTKELDKVQAFAAVKSAYEGAKDDIHRDALIVEESG